MTGSEAGLQRLLLMQAGSLIFHSLECRDPLLVGRGKGLVLWGSLDTLGLSWELAIILFNLLGSPKSKHNCSHLANEKADVCSSSTATRFIKVGMHVG